MSATDGVGDHAAWRDGARRVAVAPGVDVFVGAASDLLRSKEAAARGKDLDVLPRLRAELLAAGALDLRDVRGPVAASEHEPAPDPAAETMLGARPQERRPRALWDRGASLLAEYRQRWDIADDASLLPADPESDQGHDFAALQRQLDRLARLIGRT